MKRIIGTIITTTSDRRFLILIFQADYVLESTDPILITERLESLPKDLTAAYNSVFERMTDGDRDFSYRILDWILHAQWILKMSQLQEALAIRIGHPFLQQHLIVDATEIVRVCGGLISHNEVNDLVSFSHETVRSFLETSKFGDLPSHSILVKTYLTYLQFPIFDNPHDCEDWNEILTEHALGGYAANFWAIHVGQSGWEVELEESILKTFSPLEGWQKAVYQVRGGYYNEGVSLLQFLLENRLAFIFTRPLSGGQALQTLYDSFCNSTNSKSSQCTFTKECQRLG